MTEEAISIEIAEGDGGLLLRDFSGESGPLGCLRRESLSAPLRSSYAA